ncbi:tRNA lysidine(34) synthetase TilS [Isoptericola sp. F-RaC21]|uniref:tRNA lysidine(34) synthetase TilS n=1 Tax=Isoptericola sp. F-RaC21 TaxID=3141452 RepID=UPI00315B9BFC
MARVDPALAAARAAVRAELGDLAWSGELSPGGLVLVACSGGADSLALAAATAREAPRVGRSVRSVGFAVRVGAVVVDHGMQAGSDAVAATAAARCRELGLDPVLVRSVRVDVGPGAGGPEGGARDARYAALDAAAEETGAAAVLLGHTLDDQAESVLLGLARGSGARSLAGMPRRRGPYRRPFLGLRRAQTEAVCAAVGVDYWTDPTNLLPADGGGAAPARTRVRGAVVPALEDALGPGVVEALARTADQLRDDADALDALADDLLAAATAAPGGDELVLEIETLAVAPPAVRRRALRSAALAVGCAAGATTARHVDALDALVVSWRGQGPVHLPGDARGARACGRLYLRPTVPRAARPATPQPQPRSLEE